MPLYEYECDACGKRFEVIQKFSEVSTECRRCGKGPVRRLTSTPAIQFKGTGWYVTDYAQKGKQGGESSSGSGKSGTGDSGRSDSSGGESKADGKKADAGTTGASAPSTAKD